MLACLAWQAWNLVTFRHVWLCVENRLVWQPQKCWNVFQLRQTLSRQVQYLVSLWFFVQVHFSRQGQWLERCGVIFFSLSALARLRKVRCRAGFWANLGWSCKGVGSTLHTLHHSSHSTLWTSPPTPAHTPHPTVYKFTMIQKQRKVIEDCFNKLFFKVLYVICVRVRTTQDMEIWHIWYQNNWLRLVRSWFRSQPHITLAAVHQSLLWVNQLPNGRSMGIKCWWYFCQQELKCYLHGNKINQKLKKIPASSRDETGAELWRLCHFSLGSLTLTATPNPELPIMREEILGSD